MTDIDLSDLSDEALDAALERSEQEPPADELPMPDSVPAFPQSPEEIAQQAEDAAGLTDEELDASLEREEEWRTAGPVDLAKRGFDLLTPEDIAAEERRGNTPMGFGAEMAATDAGDLPFLGTLFEAKAAWELIDAVVAFRQGKATRDQQRMVLRQIVDAQREQRPGATFAAVLKSLGTSVPEIASGIGVGNVAARQGAKGLRKMVGDEIFDAMSKRAQVAATTRVGGLVADVGRAAGYAGATTATQQIASLAGGALGVAPGGGAWNAKAALRALDKVDLADADPEELALWLNETFEDFVDASVDGWAGMRESLVENFIEQSGGALVRLPLISHLQALEARALQRIASRVPRGTSETASQYMRRLSSNVALQGGVAEMMEEVVQGMSTEAAFGSGSMLDGLPEDLQEAAEMYAALTFPGLGVAVSARVADNRRARKIAQAVSGAQPQGVPGGGDAEAGSDAAPEAAVEPGVASPAQPSFFAGEVEPGAGVLVEDEGESRTGTVQSWRFTDDGSTAEVTVELEDGSEWVGPSERLQFPVEAGAAASPGDRLEPAAQTPAVETPEFRRWFGDSKVTDESGAPLVVYHGTTDEFTEFSASEARDDYGRRAFYFTDDVDVAHTYVGRSTAEERRQLQRMEEAARLWRSAARRFGVGAMVNDVGDARFYDEARNAIDALTIDDPASGLRRQITNEQAEELRRRANAADEAASAYEAAANRGYGDSGPRDGGNVMPVYLALQSPHVMDAGGMSWDAVMERAHEAAEANGADGLIVHNVKDVARGEDVTSTVYVAFEPTQIKSATGNTGAFDPTDPDIRDARAAEQAEAISELDQLATAAEAAVLRGVETQVEREMAADAPALAEGAPTTYEAEQTLPPDSAPAAGYVRRSPSPHPGQADVAQSPDVALAPQDAFLGPPPGHDQSHIGRQLHGSLTEVQEITEGRRVTTPEIVNAMGGIIRAVGQEPVIRQGIAANVPKGAAGAYWLREKVVDVRKVNHIVTAGHEVGHATSRAVWGVRDPWAKGGPANVSDEVRAELDRAGRQLYGDTEPNAGYMEEGWAQFFSFHLTQDGMRDMPATTQWFEETFLPAHPKIAEAVAKAQDLARVWRYMGSANRVAGSIVGRLSGPDAAREAFRGTFSRDGLERAAAFLEDAFFEELGPVRRAVKRVEKLTGEKLAPGDDPYRILDAYRGTAGARVQSMIDHGIIDFYGNRTGVPALRTIGDIIGGRGDDFLSYVFALRGRALWEQPLAERAAEDESNADVLARERAAFRDPTTGLEPQSEQVLEQLGARDPGISYVDAIETIERLEDPKMKLAAERMYQWFDGVMDYVAQASPTLAQAIAKIREVDPGFYIPLMREFVRLPGQGTRTSSAARGQVSQRLKGSGRRIKNPLEGLIAKATELVQVAHERHALDAFIALGKRHEGLGGLIREVPVSQVPGGALTVNEALRQAAQKVGVENQQLGEIITDVRSVLGDSASEVIQLFQQAQRPKTDGGAPILPVVEGTKIKWYQMDPDVYDVFAKVNPQHIQGAVDLVLGAPKRWFVQGTTGLNPAFAWITNPVRDIFQTLPANTSAGNPFRAMGLAMGSFKDSIEASFATEPAKDSYADVLVRLGIPIQTMLTQDSAATRSKAEIITREGNAKGKVATAWDAYQKLMQVPEGVSRIAEMKITGERLGWKPGDKMTADVAIQMLEAGKGVTVDFTAAGKFTRQANRYIAFFNVAFQSPRAFAKAWKRNKKAAVWRGLTTFTVPTIAYWLSVKDEEWYQEMEDEQRYSYWYLPVGNGELIRVPRAFEPAYVYGSTFEIMLNSMAGVNPEAAEKFAGRFTEGIADLGSEGTRVFAPNLMPSIAEAFVEHMRNEDSFFGMPIIPRDVEDASPQYQFNEYTSRAAKLAGEATGLSPILIEHYTEALFGTVAREGFRFSGRDMDQVGVEFEPAQTPFFGRIFQRGGEEGVRSRSVSQVYELSKDLERRRIDLRQQGKAETPEQRQERLWSADARRALSALSQIKQYTADQETRDKLLRQRRDLAREILEDHKAGRYNRDRMRNMRRRLAAEADAAEASVTE